MARRYRRKFRKMAFRRRLIPKTYTFWRALAERPVYSGGALGYFGGTTHLNGVLGLINYSDFTQLYDQYRIDMVELKFWLYCDPGGVNTLTQSTLPRLHWARDYDDITVPTTDLDIREYQNAKSVMISPYKPVVIRYKPNTCSQGYNQVSGAHYNSNVEWNKWHDLAFTDTWYGLKFFLENLGPAAVYRVVSEARVKISCRNPR